MTFIERFDNHRDDYGVHLAENGDPNEWIERICELERLVLLAVQEGTFFPTGELQFHFDAVVDEVMETINDAQAT
jgi:hypothetical protein